MAQPLLGELTKFQKFNGKLKSAGRKYEGLGEEKRAE